MLPIRADSQDQSSWSSCIMQRLSMHRNVFPSRRATSTASWNVFGSLDTCIARLNSPSVVPVSLMGSEDAHRPHRWLSVKYWYSDSVSLVLITLTVLPSASLRSGSRVGFQPSRTGTALHPAYPVQQTCNQSRESLALQRMPNSNHSALGPGWQRPLR